MILSFLVFLELALVDQASLELTENCLPRVEGSGSVLPLPSDFYLFIKGAFLAQAKI